MIYVPDEEKRRAVSINPSWPRCQTVRLKDAVTSNDIFIKHEINIKWKFTLIGFVLKQRCILAIVSLRFHGTAVPSTKVSSQDSKWSVNTLTSVTCRYFGYFLSLLVDTEKLECGR